MEIKGTFGKRITRNERSGFTVFSFITKEYPEYRNKYGNICGVGFIPIYAEGMPLTLIGDFEKGRNEDFQFKVKSVKEGVDSESITIAYLSSSLFSGIGTVMATKIVKVFGSNVVGWIENENIAEEMAGSISGLDIVKATLVVKTIRNTIELRKVFEYLLMFGGSYPAAVKACENFGDKTLDKIKENPYKIGTIIGLPFQICEAIAKHEKIDSFSDMRITALIGKAMELNSNSGNMFTSIENIDKVVKQLTKRSVFENATISKAMIVRSIAKDGRFAIEKNSPCRVYLRKQWSDEKNIVYEMNRLKSSKSTLRYDEKLIDEVEKECGITYSDGQREVFNLLKDSGLKIITGGPGTGKTTLIKGIIADYKKMYPDNIISLAAPTGRAARRMSESTGMDAKTVHRLLEYKPFGNDGVYKDKTNPLDADFVILDEMSMIDTKLFAMILGAVKNGSLIVLLGDEDQLPSVGAGNVLHDLIKSGQIEVYQLNKVYRQKSESLIIENARKINKENTDLANGDDFEIIRVNTEEEALKKIKEITLKHHKKDDIFYHQILAPTRKGVVGVNEINKEIQTLLNPKGQSIAFGNQTFRRGDKIMMTRNNYDLWYFNGDLGVINYIDETGAEIIINDVKIYVDKTLMDDIELAYGTTIHKSQGSEYPITTIVLPESPRIMLKKNLLFTAVTRAKGKVFIITIKDALETAITTRSTEERKTGLCGKLKREQVDVIPIIKDTKRYLF